jgi:NAD-dependent deacetylase
MTPFEKLAELHGNKTRLRCRPCAKTYPLADYLTETGQRYRHRGRFLPYACPGCRQRLEKSVINFGDPMPLEDLNASFRCARHADLMIVAGSSCLVRPAADVPRTTKECGGRLVIINLGKTDLDQSMWARNPGFNCMHFHHLGNSRSFRRPSRDSSHAWVSALH